MKESIRKVNQYIDENREKVNQQYRGAFHLLPPIGWMNDPNGFVYFRWGIPFVLPILSL